jgi:hypothetical protein
VVQLLGANVPADQGLSSLGLIMQLAGSLAAATVTFIGFQTLFLPSHTGTTMVLLLTTLGVVRSLMHRAAGTGLLYSGAIDTSLGPPPLRGVRRYIVVGLLHSVLVPAVLISGDLAPARMAVTIGLALAIWPLILAGLLRTPWLRRFENEVPTPEDKGFEGAAVLMTVLSIAGLAFGLLMLRAFTSRDALNGTSVLMPLCVLLLLVRSAVHLAAGITGLRSVPLDTAVERAAQYASLGLVSAFVTGGALLILFISSDAFSVAGLLVVGVAMWLLGIWPMALRRFFAERQFASMLAGDAAPIHRRAPDAGFTALGWLLIVFGAFMLSLSVLSIGGATTTNGYDESSLLDVLQPMLADVSWRTFLIAALQLGAGFELVRMGRHHRVVATLSACAIAVVGLTTSGPGGAVLSQLRMIFESPGALALLVGPLGLALSTIMLVNRKVATAGQAQVRMPARR